jgi:hypothetical protein
VAFITHEPWVRIPPLDIVRGNVVSEVSVGGDSPGEIRERNIWISPDPAFLDHAKIPVVSAGHLIVLKRQWRGHRQQIADAGRVVDPEG